MPRSAPCSLAAEKDAKIKGALTRAAIEADTRLVAPSSRGFGISGYNFPRYWSTQRNGADFGTDYFTRTAVAKSNIFVKQADRGAIFLSGP